MVSRLHDRLADDERSPGRARQSTSPRGEARRDYKEALRIMLLSRENVQFPEKIFVLKNSLYALNMKFCAWFLSVVIAAGPSVALSLGSRKRGERRHTGRRQ